MRLGRRARHPGLVPAGALFAQPALAPVTPHARPYRGPRDHCDHHQTHPHRHVHHVVQEHLHADEHQQEGNTRLEVDEPVRRTRQQEVQRPQAEDGEGVGREHHEQVPGHAEHGRDRVEREHHVGYRDGDQRHEQGGGHGPAAHPGEEPSAVVVFGDGQHPAQAAHGEVVSRPALAGPEHARPGQQHHGAEHVEDPADALDEHAAGRDEHAAEHERADHAEEQDPLLQFGWYPHGDEQQHEHEDVVHAEGSFEQVPGQVLAAGGRAPPQPQDRAERQRGTEPQGALNRRGAQAAFRAPGENEVGHDEHGDHGEGRGPRPHGYWCHRVARPASVLTPSCPAPAAGASRASCAS